MHTPLKWIGRVFPQSVSDNVSDVYKRQLYFVIKWAVKNGIKEAYSAITGKKTDEDEDIQNEKEFGLDAEDK